MAIAYNLATFCLKGDSATSWLCPLPLAAPSPPMGMALAPGAWPTENLALSASSTTKSTAMEAFHIDKDLKDQMDQSMVKSKGFFAAIQPTTLVVTQGLGPSQKKTGPTPTAILETAS